MHVNLKVLLAMASMTGFVVLNIYRAMLGASLAVKLTHKPFSTIDEVAMSSRKLIVVNNSPGSEDGKPKHDVADWLILLLVGRPVDNQLSSVFHCATTASQ